MKIAVTGAAGFIGRRIVARAREEGHEVVAVVRPSHDASRLDACGAAIARVETQKVGVQPRNTDNLTPEKQAEIREIEARRNKVRELAKTPPEEPI